MPFNTLFNHAPVGAAANVETSAQEGRVLGHSTVAISAGEELTHAYADSTAELIYRYGFVPPLPRGGASVVVLVHTLSLIHI